MQLPLSVQEQYINSTPKYLSKPHEGFYKVYSIRNSGWKIVYVHVLCTRLYNIFKMVKTEAIIWNICCTEVFVKGKTYS